jgi:hypothetical protein
LNKIENETSIDQIVEEIKPDNPVTTELKLKEKELEEEIHNELQLDDLTDGIDIKEKVKFERTLKPDESKVDKII